MFASIGVNAGAIVPIADGSSYAEGGAICPFADGSSLPRDLPPLDLAWLLSSASALVKYAEGAQCITDTIDESLCSTPLTSYVPPLDLAFFTALLNHGGRTTAEKRQCARVENALVELPSCNLKIPDSMKPGFRSAVTCFETRCIKIAKPDPQPMPKHVVHPPEPGLLNIGMSK